jgi:hypothetical protein
MKNFILLLAAISLLICACSENKPTQSGDQDSIYLSRLVVSMVPGGSETVTVTSPAGGQFEATSSDAGIASATISDSSLVVTGVAYGTTDVTVTDGSGQSCVLPVQVYNPYVLDVGELLITYTDDFTVIDEIIYGEQHWMPIPPPGFSPLSTFIVSAGNPIINPNGNNAVIVVKAKPGSDAIAFTKDFTQAPYHAGGWLPTPPAGYKAMGTFAGYYQPDSAACIREDLVTRGELVYLWGNSTYSSWKIVQPDVGPHDHAYLEAGTFLFVAGNSEPQDSPALNVLKLDFPMLAEAPVQDFIPRLTGYDQPSDETMPRMEKAMLAPCTIVNDLTHGGNIDWQVANSPFYRLERQVVYKRIYYNYNTTNELQTNSVAITSGITTDSSTTIWQQTGVELSVSAGLSFKAVSGSVTATVSERFGYETQTSVQELNSKTVTTSINIPPHAAAAAWQRFDRYILYRHDGTVLQPVRSWEFGIDSYVVDEYSD